MSLLPFQPENVPVPFWKDRIRPDHFVGQGALGLSSGQLCPLHGNPEVRLLTGNIRLKWILLYALANSCCTFLFE